MPSYPLVAVENSGGQRRCTSLPPLLSPALHPPLSPHPSIPTIPTSCCFHSVATWRWWRSMGCVRRVGSVVTWRRSGRRWRPVTWRRQVSSLALSLVSLGASDVASLASLGAGDVASSGVVVGVVGGQ